MQSLLVVAAQAYELRWILRQTERRTDLRIVGVWAGPGPRLAAAAMATDPRGFDSIVSTGLCGALDKNLKIGDVVVASEVNGEPVRLAQGAGSFTTGPILSSDRVIGTIEEKRRLRATGAIAVEMEAAAVQTQARTWGKTFYCVRAVSDTADEGFELDLNAARDQEGRFRAAAILQQTVRSPRRIVPELIRLNRNSKLASKALGDFFAHCSFN